MQGNVTQCNAMQYNAMQHNIYTMYTPILTFSSLWLLFVLQFTKVCAAAHAHVARAGAEDEAEPEKNIDWGTALGYWPEPQWERGARSEPWPNPKLET